MYKTFDRFSGCGLQKIIGHRDVKFAGHFILEKKVRKIDIAISKI